jgi:hypothetical protein
MPFFDPLTAAASLLIYASSAQALCAPPAPARINVTPKTQDIKWDYSKSLVDLQGLEMDTINPYGFDGQTMTKGYMKGAIKLMPRVKIGYKTLPNYGAACLWYESISITMEIDPTIVIPKEVRNDPCMNKAVSDHEMKHIMVDRKIVNKYSKTMGQKVYDALKQRGFSAGPVPAKQAQSIANQMQKVVHQIVEQEYKRMDLDRMDLQRAVDNIDEYKRVSALCPNYRARLRK